MMRVVGITMVKNEADIIEAFVRHNLRFLDALVVVDNVSADDTRAVLMELVREGLPLAVVDDPEVAYAQARKMTDLLATVTRVFKPDCVAPLDADEFIASEEPGVFREELSEVSDGELLAVPWKTYVPTVGDDAQEKNPVKRITRRRKVEAPQWSKVVVPQREWLQGPVSLEPGSHFARRAGAYEVLPTRIASRVALGHFPVRSAEQILVKTLVGELGYLSDPKRLGGISAHRKQRYERFLRNGAPSSGDLEQIALSYGLSAGEGGIIEDPLPLADSYALRYTSLTPVAPIVLVTLAAEQIAKRLAESGAPQGVRTAGERALESVGPSGGWSAELHRERRNCDVPPFRYVFERFRPASVLDIGCGLGMYLNRFREWGVTDLVGVEAHEMGAEFSVPGALRLHNLERPLDFGRLFDLVICVEVIEHVSATYEDVVLDSIAKHAKGLILFSGAQPGQPGIGHVNLRPTSYWVKKWKERGWAVLPFESLAFRLLANFSWFQRNGLILRRAEGSDPVEGGGGFGVPDVLRPDEGDSDWPTQAPGTYEFTLLGERSAESYVKSSEERHAQGGKFPMSRFVWGLLPASIRAAIRERAKQLR
jgi:SAM-dependent methyltransferase